LRVLVIALNLENLIEGCFGTLQRFNANDTYIYIIGKKRNLLELPNLNYIDIDMNLPTQELVKRFNFINEINPTLLLIPAYPKWFRDVLLIASRYIKNILIYSIKHNKSHLIVDIERYKKMKIDYLKRNDISTYEYFVIYKMVLLDEWL